ncbi:tetratricopeptide repeat protein [Paraburkholderia sp. RCC_158]|uniref:tetratricopeptide repeat protein n=1 Tax=Paraburkholderia sp. RCC_158 TaxID=3239220 RepID=UPI0035259DEF
MSSPALVFSAIVALDTQPLDAGRVAEFTFRRNGGQRELQLAIYHYTRARAFGRIAALLDSLTPEQRAAAEREPAFLLVRCDLSTNQRERCSMCGSVAIRLTRPDQLVASFDADFVHSGRTSPRRTSMSSTAC